MSVADRVSISLSLSLSFSLFLSLALSLCLSVSGALLATADVDAARERAKALLELEVTAVGRRWEAEKDARVNALRQDGERRMEEMRSVVLLRAPCASRV